jgi:uncharacterized protein
MAWLLVFGLAHFYLIWWGDILSLYAVIGMLAWFFVEASPRKLLLWGSALLLVQLLIFSTQAADAYRLAAEAVNGSEAARSAWQAYIGKFGIERPGELAEIISRYRSAYANLVLHRITEQGTEPFTVLLFFGWDTLGYMLLGMAALKSGFLAGTWSNRRYAQVAIAGFGIGIPVHAWLAWHQYEAGFAVPDLIAWSLAAPTAIRPIMTLGYAALVILLSRPGGWLSQRIAAAGQAAFTNYLGTSIVMTSLFYGYGLGWFGSLSRAELWLVVLPAWALMLAWSKPWLDRYRYGPLEWLWRSLARKQAQPMRRTERRGDTGA